MRAGLHNVYSKTRHQLTERESFGSLSHFAFQPSLDWEPRFLGPDLTPDDTARLGKQLALVLALMADGQWRTLRQIADRVQAPEASVSARLRDLRRYGRTVERERVTGGLWRYRVR